MNELFAFPNPVNEYSARLVAGGVVVLTALFLATGWGWVLGLIALGFLARVATGPTLSVLGQFVTRWATPTLERVLGSEGPRVPGPPKRFAQAIGAVLSLGAVVAFLAGAPILAAVLVAMITAAATLESVFGYCLGCTVFTWLMKIGLIPQSACEACANFSPSAT